MTSLIKTVTLIIGSTAFASRDFIPLKYSCEGENISPPVTVANIPTGTKSLALIVDDPDAPGGTHDHWIVWNIPPIETIGENTIPGTVGKNSSGRLKYDGPCPPSGVHRYYFKVYALDTMLGIKAGSDKKTLENAMKNHILGEGELIGLYKKSK